MMIKETKTTTDIDVRVKGEGLPSEVGKWFKDMTPYGGKWIGASFRRRDEEHAEAIVVFRREEDYDDRNEGVGASQDAAEQAAAD